MVQSEVDRLLPVKGGFGLTGITVVQVCYYYLLTTVTPEDGCGYLYQVTLDKFYAHGEKPRLFVTQLYLELRLTLKKEPDIAYGGAIRCYLKFLKEYLYELVAC